jgi:aspartate/methionine/tyrosine aminotransferase
MADSQLDFSKGDPALPLTSIARHAFRMAAASNLNHYYLPNGAEDSRYNRLEDIAQYFQQRGFLKKSFYRVSDKIVVTGGGTTEAYELVIRLLAQDLKKRMALTGETIKPVIVMPVPTYGLFFNSAREWGFELAFIERDMDEKDPAKYGGVDPQKLAALLADLDAQGKRVIAYYDSNPNNPLGCIRGRAETAALMSVISRHSAQQREHDNEDDKKLVEDIKRRGGTWKDMTHLTSWHGPASRIRVIDDIVYDGLEYAGQPKGCGFAELEDDAWGSPAHDTFTIAGPSKAGLVNLRAGIIISHGDALKLRSMQHSTSYSSSSVALHAVHAYFSNNEPFISQRKKHLDRMNAQHQFGGQFMKALIDGFDSVPDLTAHSRSRMVRLLARTDNISEGEARNRLARGIKGIRVITTPQAGFFHLIDFSGLRGRTYTYADTFLGSGDKVETFTFKNCTDIKRTFGSSGKIGFAYADWMGLDPKKPIVRATFAEKPEMIIAFVNRLSRVTETLFSADRQQPARRNAPAL